MREAVVAFVRERMRLGFETDVEALMTHAGVWDAWSRRGKDKALCPSFACQRDAWAFFDWCRERGT